MAKNFYLKASRVQLQQLQTQRAQTLAELENAKASDDKLAAAQSVQTLADLAAAETNLRHLVDQYTASQMPPAPVSPEERAARPIERMDWNDVVDLARQSKYGKDITANDPNLVAGYQEAMRRRARGE